MTYAARPCLPWDTGRAAAWARYHPCWCPIPTWKRMRRGCRSAMPGGHLAQSLCATRCVSRSQATSAAPGAARQASTCSPRSEKGCRSQRLNRTGGVWARRLSMNGGGPQGCAGESEWPLVGDITFLDLRHDFEQRAEEAGWQPEVLRSYLGYASRRMLQLDRSQWRLLWLDGPTWKRSCERSVGNAPSRIGDGAHDGGLCHEQLAGRTPGHILRNRAFPRLP